MIVVTGAAGFIGSCLVQALNDEDSGDILVVDDFTQTQKAKNLQGKKIRNRVPRDRFISWFAQNALDIDAVLHMGARTDTTEKNRSIFQKLNIQYSKDIWKICTRNGIPLVYASSASVYGDGSKGFSEDAVDITRFKALNPYAESKLEFDKWAMQQTEAPPFWAGLRFFNVYGPNEYHKGRMASVIWHAFHQVRKTGSIALFRSHRRDYADGEQKRDFVYVKDVCAVCLNMLSKKPANGFYNVGTGQARTFLDLASGIFMAMDKEPRIRFIDTPENIRDSYQYYTRADLTKLKNADCAVPFSALEQGVDDYVRGFLTSRKYF